MKANPVCWFEIYVEDMERAKAFYENVFQIKLEQLPSPVPEDSSCGDMEMWAFSMTEDSYGAAGMLIKTDQVKPGPGGSLIYFSCEDCAEESARINENGGNVFQEKMSIGEHGFIALFNDTEGNMVGLHSLK